MSVFFQRVHTALQDLICLKSRCVSKFWAIWIHELRLLHLLNTSNHSVKVKASLLLLPVGICVLGKSKNLDMNLDEWYYNGTKYITGYEKGGMSWSYIIHSIHYRLHQLLNYCHRAVAFLFRSSIPSCFCSCGCESERERNKNLPVLQKALKSAATICIHFPLDSHGRRHDVVLLSSDIENRSTDKKKAFVGPCLLGPCFY